ncbi:hypothetical protein [Limnoglobus roseus]|uniref:Uncharacterized protein n=1 Tax=Limnoglobus roseus TaxID=2598579 RepID=A0A5C1A8G3_9BACT|nr:hypothetical protein [Limnoglobus roseus]QEL15511.1 hypothetical protein PX52LOC_02435 [Limnoglobus roseus]
MLSNLLRRLRGPLLVLFALVALDLAVLATARTWDRHSPDDYAARVETCRQRRPDAVFVGGSVVSEGIVPREIVGANWQGEPLASAYALGLPGGTTSEFFHAVKAACQPPPRLLVYGITASDLNDSRHEPHGPASLMTFGDAVEWAKTRPDSRAWVLRQYALARASRVSSLWQYRHGIRMWAALQFDESTESAREAKELRRYSDALRGEDGYAPAAGFVEQRYDHVKATNGTLPPFAFLNKYKTGSHRTYLHKLICWAGDNAVSLVLVDMPVTEDLEKQYPEAFAEYRKLLAEEEAAHGLLVIRAHRDIVGITDAGFADTIHLNGVGATVLSRWLKAKLDEIGRPATLDDNRVRAQAGGDRP